MADPQIEKIKLAVAAADHIPRDKKTELLELVAKLEPAISRISETHGEHADRISTLVEQSAHAASDNNPEHLETTLGELKQSVRRFEASHPDLVSFVTEYSAFLSALGI